MDVQLHTSMTFAVCVGERSAARCAFGSSASYQVGGANPGAGLGSIGKQNVFCSCWESNTNSSVVDRVSLITILTELTRLLVGILKPLCLFFFFLYWLSKGPDKHD